MTVAHNHNEQVALDFVAAYAALDTDKIAAFLDENIVAYITNAQAELDKVEGRDAYIQRHQQMITSGVELTLTVPQIITINTGQIMFMVTVEAQRKGKTLNNHAAYLCTIINDKITELWMVDALPENSDHFWKDGTTFFES